MVEYIWHFILPAFALVAFAVMDRTAQTDPWDRTGAWWRRFWHDSPMWPVNGYYECRECGRRHRVDWHD